MKTASQRGRRNRQRGQELEREVAAALSLCVGREVKRILGQERDGGFDLCVPPLMIECKRRKRFAPMLWFATSTKGEPGEMLAVVVKADGFAPVVMMQLNDFLSLAGDKLR